MQAIVNGLTGSFKVSVDRLAIAEGLFQLKPQGPEQIPQLISRSLTAGYMSLFVIDHEDLKAFVAQVIFHQCLVLGQQLLQLCRG